MVRNREDVLAMKNYFHYLTASDVGLEGGGDGGGGHQRTELAGG